ncbi:MAG TPA: hypothetical protein PK095_20460 [Myxococcota bacterium]|nr:hypothetical protein [Myxococcota bacterium]
MTSLVAFARSSAVMRLTPSRPSVAATCAAIWCALAGLTAAAMIELASSPLEKGC